MLHKTIKIGLLKGTRNFIPIVYGHTTLIMASAESLGFKCESTAELITTIRSIGLTLYA